MLDMTCHLTCGIPGAGISVMSGTLYLCANLSADGLILLVQLVQIVQR